MKNGATGWLGFFFFVALVLVLWATLIVGDLRLFHQPFPLRIHFPAASGLRKGDDIRVDGLLFGKVREIRLHEKGGVLVEAELEGPVTLYRDARILIEASSVLGGTVVTICRGSEPPALDLGEVLPGRVRPDLGAIPESVQKVEPPLTEAIQEIRSLIKGINEGRGTIGQLVTSTRLHDELAATVQEARQAIGDARGTIAEARGALGKIREAGETVQKAVENLEKGEGPLPALLHDKSMADQLRRTLGTVQETADRLKGAAEKIDRGEGTLGRLLTDAEMGENLKKTVQSIQKSAQSLEHITERIEKGPGTLHSLVQDPELYKRAKETVEDLDKVVGKAARAVVEIVGDAKYYGDSRAQISKLGMKIRLSDAREFHGAMLEDKYFYLGASFLGFRRDGEVAYQELLEDNDDATYLKADVRLAYRIPWIFDRRLAVHAGLLEGKPGGGADLLWDDWLLFRWPVQASFEIRDAYDSVEDEDIDENLRGPLMRAYAKVPLWTGTENWWDRLLGAVRLYAGASRLGHDPEYMIGVGLEWPDDDIRSLVALLGLAR